jgi:hypothetical protein
MRYQRPYINNLRNFSFPSILLFISSKQRNIPYWGKERIIFFLFYFIVCFIHCFPYPIRISLSHLTSPFSLLVNIKHSI